MKIYMLPARNVSLFLIISLAVVAFIYNNIPFFSFNVRSNISYQTALAIPNLQANNNNISASRSNDTATSPVITANSTPSPEPLGLTTEQPANELNQPQQISLELNSADFTSLSTNKAAQVRVFVNYTVNDPSIDSQTINSVFKLYDLNRTLLKTSSSPNGFTINNTGVTRHSTTLADSMIQNVIAVVQFTDVSKTIPLSNPVVVKLNLR